MNKKQIRHELIVRMPEPFIRLLIHSGQLHAYIEGMVRYLMFQQTNYKNHQFDIIEYLNREVQWDFEYHLATFNADPSKYQPINIKKVNRSKCKVNYERLATIKHNLIQIMPYKLIHFLIENKIFNEYIKVFEWFHESSDYKEITAGLPKILLNSENAITTIIKHNYFYFMSNNTYHKWLNLNEKYKEYFINSL